MIHFYYLSLAFLNLGDYWFCQHNNFKDVKCEHSFFKRSSPPPFLLFNFHFLQKCIKFPGLPSLGLGTGHTWVNSGSCVFGTSKLYVLYLICWKFSGYFQLVSKTWRTAESGLRTKERKIFKGECCERAWCHVLFTTL